MSKMAQCFTVFAGGQSSRVATLGRDAEIIARPTDSSKRRQLPGVAVSAGRLGMNYHARLTIHKLSHCHDGRSAGAARGPDMSGIVSGINYNLLFSGETSSDATASILARAVQQYVVVDAHHHVRLLRQPDHRPQAGAVGANDRRCRGSAAAAGRATPSRRSRRRWPTPPASRSALLNPNVQKVLLTANGLASYIGETALVQKVLLSDPSGPQFAGQPVGQHTWLSTVQTYNFAKNGLAELQESDRSSRPWPTPMPRWSGGRGSTRQRRGWRTR